MLERTFAGNRAIGPAQKSSPGGIHLRHRAEGMKEHPISYAASHGHAEIVTKLLDQGVDINYQDLDGLSPLALAAYGGAF